MTDIKAAEEKLEPCPFCGSRAEIKFIGNDHTRKRSVHICCSKAGCTIEMRVGAIRFDHAWCLEKATEKWNTRTPSTN